MRKNRIIEGGVNVLSKGGASTGVIRAYINNESTVIYMELGDLIQFRDDINDALRNYMERMEVMKEDIRKGGEQK